MLDLKKLTIAEDFEDGLKGKKVFDVVRCDKPQPNEWFRLFKLGDKGFDNFIKVVITEQEDARGEKQSYLLSPEIANTYKDYLKPYHRAVLAYGYTSRGIIFIWPVKYNPEYPNLWNDTAQKIAIAACNEWTQIQSDRVQKCYTHLKMTEKNERETKDPFKNEPPIPYEKANEKAFISRIVDSEDHPVIQMVGVKANEK